MSKFSLKYFHMWYQIHENLDPQNISAIRYVENVTRVCDECDGEGVMEVLMMDGT